MCNGDFCPEYGDPGGTPDPPGPCGVSAEKNKADSWTIRIHPDGGGDGDPWFTVMTAEADPGATTVHVKAVRGSLPPDCPGKVQALLKSFGFTHFWWERVGRDGRRRTRGPYPL